MKVQISTETQVDQAELAVKNAELNVSLSKEVWENTQASVKDDLAAAQKNVEAARTALEQAQKDLENVLAQTKQATDSLVDNAQTLYNNQLVSLDNVYNYCIQSI